MLLSDVIQISKNLNESYKSNFFIELNKFFDKSILAYKKVKVNYTYQSHDDIEYVYYLLARNMVTPLTLELCDDPNERKKLLNFKYEYKGFNLMKFIYNQFSKYDYSKKFSIDYANITNDDFEDVEIKDARKGNHKSQLLFWMGYTDTLYNEDGTINTSKELKAVTYNNEILFLVNHNPYSKYHVVNDNYTGPTKITEKFKEYLSKDVSDFIKKAFYTIPDVKIVTDKDEIKELIGGNKVISLQKWSKVASIKGLKNDKVDNEDFINKLNSRKEWKLYLEELRNVRENNIKRYKKIHIKNTVLKSFKTRLAFLDDVFNVYINHLNAISKIEQNILSGNSEFKELDYNILYGTYIDAYGNERNKYIKTYIEAIPIINEKINAYIINVIKCKELILKIIELESKHNNHENLSEISDKIQEYNYKMRAIIDFGEYPPSVLQNIASYSYNLLPTLYNDIYKLTKQYGLNIY